MLIRAGKIIPARRLFEILNERIVLEGKIDATLEIPGQREDRVRGIIPTSSPI